MVNLHPSLEIVYAVTAPIRDLGALPGDELVFRPQDPDFPLTLIRHFPIEMGSVIPHQAVKMLDAVPAADAQASAPPAPSAREQTPAPLRLVS